jgi:hypothetical protein
MADGWFALLTRRQLQRRAFRSTHALEMAIRCYIAASNTDPKPLMGTKTADNILDTVKRFRQRTSYSHRSLDIISLPTAVRLRSVTEELLLEKLAILLGARRPMHPAFSPKACEHT